MDRKGLVARGDYIATFMAWLEEVKAGGGTAFIHPGKEDMLVRTSSKNDSDFLGFQASS